MKKQDCLCWAIWRGFVDHVWPPLILALFIGGPSSVAYHVGKTRGEEDFETRWHYELELGRRLHINPGNCYVIQDASSQVTINFTGAECWEIKIKAPGEK